MAMHGFLRTFNILSSKLLADRVGHVHVVSSKMFLKSDSISRLKELNAPSKPKKPMLPFMRFVKENYAIVAKDNPNFKQMEIVKKCSENWKTVSTDLKEKYTTIYKTESEEYDKQLVNYMASLTEEQINVLKSIESKKREDRKKRKLRKLCKESNKPKRPIPSYMRYLLEQSKLKNLPITAIMASNKGQWANMSSYEKKKYEDAYKKDKEEFDIALKKWEEKMIEDGHKELVRMKTLAIGRPSRISQVKKSIPQ